MLQPEDNLLGDKVNVVEKIQLSLQDQNNQRKEIFSNGLVSDLFDKNILARLERIFSESSFRPYTLPAEQFRAVIAAYIPLALVENVYRSIDVNDVGYVDFSDFTNYLIASENNSAFSAKTYISRLVPYLQQEDDVGVVHRDCIDCLLYLRKPCHMLVTGGRDGQLSLWDPESLELLANIAHQPKTTVYKEELDKSMDKLMKIHTTRAMHNLGLITSEGDSSRSNQLAITALCPILNTGYLCVGSADCCITIYDMTTQDVVGRITTLENIPTAAECFQVQEVVFVEGDASNNTTINSMNSPMNNSNDSTLNNLASQSSDSVSNNINPPVTTNANNNGNNTTRVSIQQGEIATYLVVGDSKGYLHIIKLHPEFGISTEVGLKKKNQNLFIHSITHNYRIIKAHDDWITQISYIEDINALITGSVDGVLHFIDINRYEILKSFLAHKQTSLIGIQSFDYSSIGKYIVSGGARNLIFWDPFTLDAMNRIENLRSPVVKILVLDHVQKLIVSLSNKTLMMFHYISFELQQIINDTAHYKPLDILSSIVYCKERNTLYTAGNRLSLWKLERYAILFVLKLKLINLLMILSVLIIDHRKIWRIRKEKIYVLYCIIPCLIKLW